MACQLIVHRSISAYWQVKMRTSLKYMIVGMSEVSGLGLGSWGGEIKAVNSVLGVLSKNVYVVKVMFFFLNFRFTCHN
jgi:hypothetical protein